MSVAAIAGATDTSDGWQAWVPLANVASGIAASVGVLLAVLTVGVAVYQIWKSGRFSKEGNAVQTYDEYLKLCLQYPELSSAVLALDTLPSRTFSSLVEQLTPQSERYLWFLSFMLNACEKIIEIGSKQRAWNEVVADQVRYHKPALIEAWPTMRKHYFPKFQKLVDEVLDNA